MLAENSLISLALVCPNALIPQSSIKNLNECYNCLLKNVGRATIYKVMSVCHWPGKATVITINLQYNFVETQTILSNKVTVYKKPVLSKKINKANIVAALAYLFILVFTYASIRVLSDYNMFVREVYTLTVLEAVKWGLAVLCAGEILTVICLVIPKLRFAGIILAFVMMFAINIASMIVLQRAPIIPFLFGGIFPSVDFWGHLYINLSLLVIALIGVLLLLNERNKQQ